jgi:hypothetical protein
LRLCVSELPVILFGGITASLIIDLWAHAKAQRAQRRSDDKTWPANHANWRRMQI